jgi:hypothetical protein
MGSSCKLLWNQPIRGVLRRPSELAGVTGKVHCRVKTFDYSGYVSGNDTLCVRVESEYGG